MPRRIQFSLSSLLMLCITISALIGYFFAQKKTNALLAENRVLLDERDEFKPDDPNKFWVKPCRPSGSLQWRWRWNVYAPGPQGVFLNFNFAQDPQHEGKSMLMSPNGWDQTSLGLPQGHSTIEAGIEATAHHEYTFVLWVPSQPRIEVPLRWTSNASLPISMNALPREATSLESGGTITLLDIQGTPPPSIPPSGEATHIWLSMTATHAPGPPCCKPPLPPGCKLPMPPKPAD